MEEQRTASANRTRQYSDMPRSSRRSRDILPVSKSRSNDNVARSQEEDDDNVELTEIALPSPVQFGISNHEPDLERREAEARKSNEQGQDEDEAELTEMAMPDPVNDKTRSLDEGTASRSPHNHESLEERQEMTEKSEAEYKPSPLLTEIYTVSWLIFFSFWGTLARLGVEAITLYPNSPFPSRILWANLGGSFIMGFLAEDRRLFYQEWGSPDPKASATNHGKVKKTIPLFIGLSTGFCGCFTSFSSFIRDAFLALTNDLQTSSSTMPYTSATQIASRNGGFSFLALMAILIIHPAVSLGSFLSGAHFALMLQPLLPAIPIRLTRKLLDPAAVVLGFGFWLGAVLLSIFPPGNPDHWRTRAVFPLIFSPPGCLLRFYFSKHLNARIPSFPLGTFTANIFGTAVLGMAWDLQHTKSIGASVNLAPTACAVLQGVMEGFCGCLTTVSTWVAELHGLRRGHGWRYGLGSVGVALSVMILIMGSMGWTIGFSSPICG